jgi:hypothetical protein
MVVAVSPVDATRVAVAPAADVRTAVPAAAAPALLVAANNATGPQPKRLETQIGRSALPANQPQSGAFALSHCFHNEDWEQK